MDSIVSAINRRELGFKQIFQLNKVNITRLSWKEYDRIGVSPGNPIYSLEFCPASTQPKIVAASDEQGGISLIDTQTVLKNKVIARHQCHPSSLYSISWSILYPNLIATGASDQNVFLWDANNFTKLAHFRGHSKTVRRVRFHHSHPDLLGSAGRDGNIFLWDIRTTSNMLAENEIYCAHSLTKNDKAVSHSGEVKGKRRKKPVPPSPTPVTDFIFLDDNTLISCGATDGQIKFWDIRKTYKYLQKVEPVRYYDTGDFKGYSSLCIDQTGNLYASTAKDNILRFNVFKDSTQPETVFKRPQSDYCVSINLSQDGRYLASGSVTPDVSIWDTWDKSSFLPFASLEGSISDAFACPSVAFSPIDPFKIVTGADDSSLTIWRLNINENSFKSRIPSTMDLATIKPAETEMFYTQALNQVYKPSIKDLKNSRNSHSASSLKPLSDLPNYVIDGRLPHVPIEKKTKSSYTGTWLENFSKSKPLIKPALIHSKKTIKLKRRVLPSSSSQNSNKSNSDELLSCSFDEAFPEKIGVECSKKRRLSLPQNTSKGQSVRKKTKSGIENEDEAINTPTSSPYPSILKYFSPISSITLNSPLKDIDNDSSLVEKLEATTVATDE